MFRAIRAFPPFTQRRTDFRYLMALTPYLALAAPRETQFQTQTLQRGSRRSFYCGCFSIFVRLPRRCVYPLLIGNLPCDTMG